MTSFRARLALTGTGLVVVGTGIVLLVSWWLLGRHLERTVPLAYAQEAVDALAGQYLLALAGVALVALGLGWAAAGRLLAPVGAIAATARRVGEEHLGERVRPSGPRDELHELATAFDGMLDRMEAAVEAQRRFVANASHELRTPLTVIRTEAEVALDDPAARPAELRSALHGVVETAERTEALLDGLLVLAASAAGARRDEPLELAAVARRAAADVPRVRADLRPAPVRGDAALLERLVANLLENAVRHGRRGGEVRQQVAPDADAAVLSVANDGDPVPPEALEHLVEPFARLHRHRAARGSGLGLSIVRSVAEVHGGTLRLTAPAAGGLRAEVRLPVSVTAT